MCDHIWGIRSRKDGGRQTDHAVHCQRVRGDRFFDSADQGHGVGHKSIVGIIWECEDIEKQQFLAVWEVSGAPIQCAGRAGRSKYHELLVREIQGCGSNYE